MKLIITTLIFFLQINLSSQVKIYVDHSGADLIGRRLAFQIKEVINNSSSMTTTYLKSDATIIINLITMEDFNSEGYLSIYSVSWLTHNSEGCVFNYVFLSSTIGYTGTERVNECAEGLVADTDKLIQGLIQEASDKY